MAVQGVPKFDALAILKIDQIDFLQGPSLVAHAAFVDTKTGKTHGHTLGRNWSKETIAKLEELKELMERDMAELHFVQDESISEYKDAGGSVEPAGIGERLDARSI